MIRIARELSHDLKEMGIHLWMIPLAALAFIVMTYFVQAGLDAAGNQNIITLPMLEALIPTLGGYGALMLMQCLLDTVGGPSRKSIEMLKYNAIVIGVFSWGLGQVWLRPPR